MIAYLEGTVQAILDKWLIINVNGVGYRVTIPDKMKLIIPKIGAPIKVYTFHSSNPRDGSTELYGFFSAVELLLFELLTSVSGIGPKSAQAIMAASELKNLRMAIMKGDEGYLSKFSGVGPKTAKRLILELKEKIQLIDLGGGDVDLTTESEAVDALVTLGYTQAEAREALNNLPKSAGGTEERIRSALKSLYSKKTK